MLLDSNQVPLPHTLAEVLASTVASRGSHEAVGMMKKLFLFYIDHPDTMGRKENFSLRPIPPKKGYLFPERGMHTRPAFSESGNSGRPLL